MASVYAMTNDPKLDSLMDRIIRTIGKAQRADGYIHTPVIIEDRNQTNKETAFSDRLNFETYNLGHLMTTASAELARNAICPSHYMGVVEMYRTTRNPAYLNLAKNLIDILKCKIIWKKQFEFMITWILIWFQIFFLRFKSSNN